MEIFYGGLEPWVFWAAVATTFVAGFVKGAIGFAMPLIMMSVFGTIMSPTLALAGLILATVTTNIHQTFRDGVTPAREAIWKYRRMIAMTILGILITAPFVTLLPQRLLLGLLGLPIAIFALLQLTGRSLALKLEHQTRAEYISGAIGGLYGGVSGIWGPPVLVYLLSVKAPKAEMIRAQGAIFLIGAVVLAFAHLGSGVLNTQTLPFSAAMVVPAALGMAMGFRLQDKLDPVQFRRWTLVLLALTALNLLRKAIFG